MSAPATKWETLVVACGASDGGNDKHSYLTMETTSPVLEAG